MKCRLIKIALFIPFICFFLIGLSLYPIIEPIYYIKTGKSYMDAFAEILLKYEAMCEDK